MERKLKVGIVGASGYSGEELVRLLARHPRVELTCLASRSLAGKPAVQVMPQFRGLLSPDLIFSASDPGALAMDPDLELVFLALPHGVAAEFAIPLAEAGKRVIDLSADFRLFSAELYESYYGHPHPAPDWLAKTPYVIPEIAGDGWQKASLISSPGCYPTSIITPLYPLLQAGLIATGGIIANSSSGVSGAGKKVSETYLYCERTESATAYGMPRHRHLSEIEEQLSLAAGSPLVLQFNPHLAPMRRGILSTISAPAAPNATLDKLYAVWEKTFQDRPFVSILPSGTFPDTALTVGTNRLDIAAVYDARMQRFVICSAEDNLLKGASGQAVQIMNLWLGFNETDGLL